MDFGQVMESFLGFFGNVPGLREALGILLVFFVPGFAWTYVIFRKVNIIERLVLAIGLSVALVALCLIVLDVIFGMSISGGSALLTIIVLTIIAVAVVLLKRWRRRRREAGDGGD